MLGSVRLHATESSANRIDLQTANPSNCSFNVILAGKLLGCCFFKLNNWSIYTEKSESESALDQGKGER